MGEFLALEHGLEYWGVADHEQVKVQGLRMVAAALCMLACQRSSPLGMIACQSSSLCMLARHCSSSLCLLACQCSSSRATSFCQHMNVHQSWGFCLGILRFESWQVDNSPRHMLA